MPKRFDREKSIYSGRCRSRCIGSIYVDIEVVVDLYKIAQMVENVDVEVKNVDS